MRSLVVLFLLLVLALPAFSQSNYAVISGTVTDSQHLPVAWAIIQLNAYNNGVIRQLTSQEQGRFEAPALLPDAYELQTTAAGFAVETQRVRLEVGKRLGIDLNLRVWPVKEGVEVKAANDVLRTTDASVGEVIEPKSIR